MLANLNLNKLKKGACICTINDKITITLAKVAEATKAFWQKLKWNHWIRSPAGKTNSRKVMFGTLY